VDNGREGDRGKRGERNNPKRKNYIHLKQLGAIGPWYWAGQSGGPGARRGQEKISGKKGGSKRQLGHAWWWSDKRGGRDNGGMTVKKSFEKKSWFRKKGEGEKT